MMRKKCVNIRLPIGWPLKNHLPGHWGTVHTVSFRVNAVVLRLILEDQNPTRMQSVQIFQRKQTHSAFNMKDSMILNSWTLWYNIHGLLELLLHQKLLLVFITLLFFQQILKRIKCFVHKDCLAFILGTPSVSSCPCVCFSKSSGANEQLEIH